ncbi:MAG: hypothetical protein WED00_16360 [Aquisalimonadaceae bacterium]
MEIEKSWIPTLLCIINDSVKYNDMLRNSDTVNDQGDIEEWMLQIFHFKQYVRDNLKNDEEIWEKVKKYLDE